MLDSHFLIRDLPCRADNISHLNDLNHVAGWEPYDLVDLGHVYFWLDLYCADRAEHITAAG